MGAGVLCFEGLGSWFPPRSCRVPAAKDARSRGARVRAWAHEWRTSWMRVSSTSLLIAKSLSQMAIAVGALSSHRRGPVSRISAASGRHSRGGGGGVKHTAVCVSGVLAFRVSSPDSHLLCFLLIWVYPG